jgi:hypothetical protein
VMSDDCQWTEKYFRKAADLTTLRLHATEPIS